MNEKNKIISKYKKKIKQIKLLNDSYYNKDTPKVTDAEYDDLKKEVL